MFISLLRLIWRESIPSLITYCCFSICFSIFLTSSNWNLNKHSSTVKTWNNLTRYYINCYSKTYITPKSYKCFPNSLVMEPMFEHVHFLICCLILFIHFFLFQKRGKNNNKTRGPWWPCNAHLSNIALWEPDLELIKANILIKVQNDYNKVFCWFRLVT